MPSRAIGTSTVFASVYCLSMPSQPVRYIVRISSLAPSACNSGQPIEVLEGVVWPIVGAPAHEALQIAAVVEVAPKKLAASRNVFGHKPPFQHRPLGRLHGGGNSDGDLRCQRPR